MGTAAQTCEEVVRMAEWVWTDSWELGYELECSNCGRHIDVKNEDLVKGTGRGLPKQCPYCNSEMEVMLI